MLGLDVQLALPGILDRVFHLRHALSSKHGLIDNAGAIQQEHVARQAPMRVHVQRLSPEQFRRQMFRERYLITQELLVFCELYLALALVLILFRHWFRLVHGLDDHDIARHLTM